MADLDKIQVILCSLDALVRFLIETAFVHGFVRTRVSNLINELSGNGIPVFAEDVTDSFEQAKEKALSRWTQINYNGIVPLYLNTETNMVSIMEFMKFTIQVKNIYKMDWSD